MTSAARRFYGVAEIGQALGVPRQTVAQWYKRGRLPAPDEVLRMGPVWTARRIEPWIAKEQERIQASRETAGRGAASVLLLIFFGIFLYTQVSKSVFHRALDRNDVNAIERAGLRLGNAVSVLEGMIPILIAGLVLAGLPKSAT